VFGVTRSEGSCAMATGRQGTAELRLVRGDVRGARVMATILREVRPDLVFHLAAETIQQTPAGTLLETNITGTLNVLEAAAALSPTPRILVASSSAVYGASGEPEQAIPETAPLQPVTMYGLSKAAQEVVAARWGADHGLAVIRARAFNHTGPGEGPERLPSAVARQLALAERGGARHIILGSVSSLRDYSDVRDIARGYYAALVRGRSGEAYNLCSGRAVAIREIVRQLIERSGMSVDVVQRSVPAGAVADVPCQIGDGRKAERELDWRPELSLEESLADLLEDWRRRTPNTP
jgi:GDP-4-dehydro-6-deoxy-D-mannose reductase